ncbi:hypothetical protein JCM10207_001797 [Rhodosporidiobolus poonsookiae]
MRLTIFGGAGFVGSSVARKAVARGWTVTSVSRSGAPFRTPAGHAPSWVDKVQWHRGDVFRPSSYSALLADSDAVVTTLGVLFERDYKTDSPGQGVSPLKVVRNVLESAAGGRGNPLDRQARERSYERINRDSALTLFRAFSSSLPSPSPFPSPSPSTPASSPFVFISAEDIFRPFVPARYITSKREAEEEMSRLALEAEGEAGRRVRPVFVRPSLMYHPHLSPPSTLPATLLEASSRLSALLPSSLHLPFLRPSPSSFPSSAPPPATASIGGLLSIPPIHVDAVGEAVCRAIEDGSVRGAVGVRGMRRMLGMEEVGRDWEEEEREKERVVRM